MIEELLDNLWRVGGCSWNGRTAQLSADGDSNVYLLKAGDRATLIDCGMPAGMEMIEANIRRAGVPVGTISKLLLTHCHYDHSAAAAEWRRRCPLEVCLSSVGAEYLAREDYRLTGRYSRAPDFKYEPFDVDRHLIDGESFMIAGGLICEPVALPGHTPDSMLLSVQMGGKTVGFCGDVTFGVNERGELGNVGWLCLAWCSDLHAYRASLAKLAEMRFDLLLPGHGFPLVGQEEISRAIAASQATIEHFLADPLVHNFGMRPDHQGSPAS